MLKKYFRILFVCLMSDRARDGVGQALSRCGIGALTTAELFAMGNTRDKENIYIQIYIYIPIYILYKNALPIQRYINKHLYSQELPILQYPAIYTYSM